MIWPWLFLKYISSVKTRRNYLQEATLLQTFPGQLPLTKTQLLSRQCSVWTDLQAWKKRLNMNWEQIFFSQSK